ncbi:MAG: hypothetical protein Q8Q33_00085 [Chlamydiota bacterium]|nr:hypothetical protein [Chlamydiota bacterium]
MPIGSFIFVCLRLIFICYVVFYSLRHPYAVLACLLVSMILGWRKGSSDLVHFCHFIIDKILYFTIFVILVDINILSVPIVAWLIAGEFIDSGARLLRITDIAGFKVGFWTILKNHIFIALGILLYSFPILETHLYIYPNLWGIMLYAISAILVIWTAINIYFSIKKDVLNILLKDS